MRCSFFVLSLTILAAVSLYPSFAQDRPDNVRPWVPPADNRSRVLDGLQNRERPRAYEDRSSDRQLPVIDRRNSQRPAESAAPSVGLTYEDRSRTTSRARASRHAAQQYGLDIIGTRQRVERQLDGNDRSLRSSFERLQRLRREEMRVRP